MGTRLGEEAKRALEAAGELARRHRHASLEPEHLLRVLLADARLAPVFEERAVDCDKLAAALDARLAQWPASGLYRDARVEPTPTPRLEVLLLRSTRGGPFSRFRVVTLGRLARAACDPRPVAALLFEARTESELAAAAFEQAHSLAVARGHDAASALHLLRAVAEQAALAEPFVRARVDVGELVGALEKQLKEHVPTPELAVRLVNRAASRDRMLVALLRIPAIAHLFHEQGVAVTDVMRALARDSLPVTSGDDLPDGTEPRVDIVFHDDDFTTMEHVVGVLSTCLAADPMRARGLTRVIHNEGAAVVKTCSGREARWRIEKARAVTERAGMPLRISWRATAELANSPW